MCRETGSLWRCMGQGREKDNLNTERNIVDEIRLGSMACELGLLTSEDFVASIEVWLQQDACSLQEVLADRFFVDADDLALARALVGQTHRAGSSTTAMVDETWRCLSGNLGSASDRREPEDSDSRFQALRQYAKGGLGLVFEGYDRELDRKVAIKFLDPGVAQDPRAQARFLQESAIAGALEHPSIVPVHGRGVRPDGTPFFAMRMIQGKTLRQVVDQFWASESRGTVPDRMQFRRLIGHLVPVGQAIGYAHKQRVIHRDLKPSNVIVGEHGEIMLIDWGLARRIGQPDAERDAQPIDTIGPGDSDLTMEGTALGTLAYMSPEQARGDKTTGISTDIHGLGAILFYVLTGTPPRDAKTDQAMLELACQGSVDEHRLRDPRVPPALAAVCLKALSPDPENRYPSAANFVKDIENFLADEPVSALPESRWQTLRRWARSHQSMVASGLASLFVALLAMGFSLTLLAGKNESLRKSNLREQASALQSAQNAKAAQLNGAEAVRQRQRVLGILNTFLMEVERGLAEVPGSAAVQRNVLTTVLQQLSDISAEFASDGRLELDNAMALVELGDLFARVGTRDIQLDLPHWDQKAVTPLDAASTVYAVAIKITSRALASNESESRRLMAVIQLKQAGVLRQSGRTSDAIHLLTESLATRRSLLAEESDSVEAAVGVVAAIDILGQIHLQNGNLVAALKAYDEILSILKGAAIHAPDDAEVIRLTGVAKSRLADIALGQGQLDRATELYQEDLAIATKLVQIRPNDLTTRRDLCTSLDRMGNLSVQQGLLDKAMEAFLESRRIRKELQAAEPASLKASQELFVSLMKCGDTRMLQRDFANAQLDYEQASILADQMVLDNPNNTMASRFQSLAAEVLADVLIEQEKWEDALRYANKSLEISRSLAENDPDDGQAERDLYIGHLKVAKVHLRKEDYEACLASLELALPIARSRYDKQPESRQAIGDYGGVLLRKGEVYLRWENAPAAIVELTAALALSETIPESARQDARSRRELANTTMMLGRAQLLNGQTQLARETLERSRKVAQQMIAEDMRAEQMRSDLAEIEETLSSITDKNSP